MIFKLLILAVLTMAALVEMGLAIYCLRRCDRGRVTAYALLLSAPLQVLSALWGVQLISACHTQSSFDAPMDGFEILFKAFVMTGILMLWSVILGICCLGSLLFGRADGNCAGAK
ncbi:MAG: hypothetical protein K8T89_24735 [Planctomycetes bacterium]|nr:hypothetical protein [Planctomycetota bacterium]